MVEVGATEFAISLEKYKEKLEDNYYEFQRRFIQEVGLEIVTNSPVKTGFFRSMWNTNIGPSPEIKYDIKDPKKTYNEPNFSIKIPNKLEDNEFFFYTNSTVYGGLLEYGYSPQAPDGIIRVIVANQEQIAERVLMDMGI